MSKIQGSYPCTYCHGDPDNACSACDPECNCVELENHRSGDCEWDCQFCSDEK